jgi:hypothetical protein
MANELSLNELLEIVKKFDPPLTRDELWEALNGLAPGKFTPEQLQELVNLIYPS